MAEERTQLQTVEAWGNIVIQIWQDKIRALNITDKKVLLNSFVHHISTASGGNVERIEFMFRMYGRFVDMGVGRGTRYGQFSKRKPRLWYSKTFYSQTKELVNILAAKYAYQGQAYIINEIQDEK
jgi:hypothetical protein